jgi:hypothetical protein
MDDLATDINEHLKFTFDQATLMGAAVAQGQLSGWLCTSGHCLTFQPRLVDGAEG